MYQLRFFILFLININQSSCDIQALYDAGNELFKLYLILDEVTLNTTEDLNKVNEIFLGNNDLSQKINHQMTRIHEEVDLLDKSINPKVVQYSFKFLPTEVLLYRSVDRIELFVSAIDEFYEEFRRYTKGSYYFNNRPLHALLKKLDLNLEGYLRIIRHLVSEHSDLPNHDNLIDAITKFTINSEAVTCDGDLISSGLIKLFKMALVAEIKADVMAAFVNLFEYTSNEKWKVLNLAASNRFQQLFRVYADLFTSNLKKTDALYLRACDPEPHTWIRDESFYELEGTFQATIFRHHWAACKFDSCNAVLFKKQEQCHPSIYDVRSSCSTKSDECAYLSAVQACVLKSGPYKFLYVNSTELGFLGRNSECPKNNGYMIQDGTGWNFNFATCACNCYGNNNKINLSIVRSRVNANMIVIGLRFIRQNDILHIQAREAKLEANGRIIQRTARWIRIYGTKDTHLINKENRVFFLDDLHLPPNYALTGIKFNRVTRGTVTGFAIEIFGHSFDYRSGKLSSEKNYEISGKASNKEPGESLLFTPINSIYAFTRNKPSPGPMTYISLERSSLRHDFGQSTLPLFDAIPVTSSSSILGGIGIFHKGVEGYAGFISFRVYGIQYSKYFLDFKERYEKSGLFVTPHIVIEEEIQ